MRQESEHALCKAVEELKRDGYKVLVVMLKENDDHGTVAALSSETNDPQTLQAILKSTFERLFPLDTPNKEVALIRPIAEWEVSAWTASDGKRRKFAPGQEPKMLVSVSAECSKDECDRCPGTFVCQDRPDSMIMCVHECHLAKHHDSYVPPA